MYSVVEKGKDVSDYNKIELDGSSKIVTNVKSGLWDLVVKIVDETTSATPKSLGALEEKVLQMLKKSGKSDKIIQRALSISLSALRGEEIK